MEKVGEDNGGLVSVLEVEQAKAFARRRGGSGRPSLALSSNWWLHP